jgi:hypothetical protein
MACGDKAKSLLPVIGSAFQSRVRQSTGQPVAVPPRSIKDFHCAVCGFTKPDYPNYPHKCPGPQPVAYQIARQAMCGECPHNRAGICAALKTMLPDRPCEVAIGIAMPGVECPLKRWRRVLFACNKCGSVRFGEHGLLACPTCRAKPTGR